MNSPQSSSDVPVVGSTEADLSATLAPGRPERADKARNRARILAAASEAFAEQGVDAQMDDIAARAGLGVGTLYRHFATKEALMVALVERKFELVLEVTKRGTEREDGAPFEIFADVLREGAEVTATDAAAQDALMRTGDFIWSAIEPTLLQLRAALQLLIDRAQQDGSMRPDISADDMSMIMCGVSATMSSEEWNWRRYLEIVLDGLRV